MVEEPDDNRCPDVLACPVCTESDIDRLLIDEDDVVRCMSCNTRYSVASGMAVILDFGLGGRADSE
jgi:uncharacterized protein YbaR (Trm112 family)